MGIEFERIVNKAHRGKPAYELMGEPVHRLKGVSREDAKKLSEAFGVDTIEDLANNRYFRAAKTIRDAALSGFDAGPPPKWIDLFAATPVATYEARPDLFRLDFGPVFYRGRLDGTAQLLVVGQDPSVNEILAQRVFVGRSGQRLQGFLARLGVTRSYLMLNTFSYSIFGQFEGDTEKLSREDPILGHRNVLFDTVADDNPIQAVVAVGSAARDAVDRWEAGSKLPKVHILHPAFPDEGALLDNWNHGLAELRPIVEPDDGGSPFPDYGAQLHQDDVVPIPRFDLNFGVPHWHGVGDHGRRAGDPVIEWHSHPLT